MFLVRHHGTTTSFMNALSLSKSAPRMSQGNSLPPLDGLHDERAFPHQKRDALGPTGRHINHGHRLDERAGNRRAAMRHQINLAETWWRVVPVVERPDWHLATYRRAEASATALAASRRNLHLAQPLARGHDPSCRASDGHVALMPAGAPESSPPVACRRPGRMPPITPSAHP